MGASSASPDVRGSITSDKFSSLMSLIHSAEEKTEQDGRDALRVSRSFAASAGAPSSGGVAVGANSWPYQVRPCSARSSHTCTGRAACADLSCPSRALIQLAWFGVLALLTVRDVDAAARIR